LRRPLCRSRAERQRQRALLAFDDERAAFIRDAPDRLERKREPQLRGPKLERVHFEPRFSAHSFAVECSVAGRFSAHMNGLRSWLTPCPPSRRFQNPATRTTVEALDGISDRRLRDRRAVPPKISFQPSGIRLICFTQHPANRLLNEIFVIGVQTPCDVVCEIE